MVRERLTGLPAAEKREGSERDASYGRDGGIEKRTAMESGALGASYEGRGTPMVVAEDGPGTTVPP